MTPRSQTSTTGESASGLVLDWPVERSVPRTLADTRRPPSRAGHCQRSSKPPSNPELDTRARTTTTLGNDGRRVPQDPSEHLPGTGTCSGAVTARAQGTAVTRPLIGMIARSGAWHTTDPSVICHGTPLCQEAAGSGVLRCGLAGPGSGLSEEPALGCEPVALESESCPVCPPGPVLDLLTVAVITSSSMVR